MNKTIQVVMGIAIVAILMFVLVSCESDEAKAPTSSVDALNFFQVGELEECEYGVYLQQPTDEEDGFFVIVLPPGTYTINYSTEYGVYSKDVVVTSSKDARIFIGLLAGNGELVDVWIGSMYLAIGGEVAPNVCQLDDDAACAPGTLYGLDSNGQLVPIGEHCAYDE